MAKQKAPHGCTRQQRFQTILLLSLVMGHSDKEMPQKYFPSFVRFKGPKISGVLRNTIKGFRQLSSLLRAKIVFGFFEKRTPAARSALIFSREFSIPRHFCKNYTNEKQSPQGLFQKNLRRCSTFLKTSSSVELKSNLPDNETENKIKISSPIANQKIDLKVFT